jgi:transposase
MIKTEQKINKSYTYFIGIDVSKHELDFAILREKSFLFHREIKNTPESILLFFEEVNNLKEFNLANCIFALEHTGYYSNHLLDVLHDLNANVTVEHGLRIKNSSGLTRGKDDKIDAQRIASYAFKNREELPLGVKKRPIISQLKHLMTLRYRLVEVSKILKTPLKEQKDFVSPVITHPSIQSCKKSMAAINKDLKGIDLTMQKLIKSDVNLKRLNELIRSVPGIGPVTSVQILISTNEFKDFRNPKKFACYAGIAPFIRESGLQKGKARVSRFANLKLKSLLHMCAVAAVTRDPDIRIFYKRKTGEEGKAKMAVFNAVKNKLVLRIFSCVNQDRHYEKNYKTDKQAYSVAVAQ